MDLHYLINYIHDNIYSIAWNSVERVDNSVIINLYNAHINGNKISEYHIDLDVAFIIDRDRK